MILTLAMMLMIFTDFGSSSDHDRAVFASKQILMWMMMREKKKKKEQAEMAEPNQNDGVLH